MPHALRSALILVFAAGLAQGSEHLVPNDQGALDGKTVVFSPGHGYQFLNGAWRWQRPLLHEIREDIHTNEIFIEVVQRYLAGAGARVESCRERSFQTEEVIVDDTSPGYQESGTWTSSTSVPAHYGSRYRYATSSPTQSATASFTPTIQKAGVYPVYVWFTQGANRADDVLYRVHHAGGVSEVRLQQQTMGNHWRFLGEWGFAAGTAGRVEISNQGADATKVVIADAVRFGGGVGQSGQARWREGAKAFLTYKGFSSTREEVTIRPVYGVWLAGNSTATWQRDWRYVALHSNAGGGTGTSTFSFGNGRGGVGPAGYHAAALASESDRLRALINGEIVRTVRGIYDPSWTNRGTHTANFGELRESRNMPSCLIELAFHDHAGDSARIRDARFRHDTGRAIYKGILRSFAPNATVSPLPPTALRIENAASGELRLSWEPVLDPLEPGAAPTGYRVYTSPNGWAFDDGVAVQGTDFVLTGLTPGQRVFVKVAATNDGGEGLATPVGGAVVREPRAERVLLVDGFTRSYRFTSTNWAQRYTYDYSREHVGALQGALPSHVGVDYARHDGVGASGFNLDPYAMVDWLLGRESSEDATFDSGEQTLVSGYLGQGGRLFVSGTEIGWDLGAQGGGNLFLEAQLGARYVRDDAGVTLARPTPTSPFAGVGNLDFGRGRYLASTPDVLEPSMGAEALLAYETGGAPVAATGIRDQVVTLGFPLEAIADGAQRTRLMEGAVDYLDPSLPAPPVTAPGGTTGTGTAPVTSTGTTAAGSTAAGGGGGGGGGGCSVSPEGTNALAWLALAALLAGLVALRRF